MAFRFVTRLRVDNVAENVRGVRIEESVESKAACRRCVSKFGAWPGDEVAHQTDLVHDSEREEEHAGGTERDGLRGHGLRLAQQPMG